MPLIEITSNLSVVHSPMLVYLKIVGDNWQPFYVLLLAVVCLIFITDFVWKLIDSEEERC